MRKAGVCALIVVLLFLGSRVLSGWMGARGERWTEPGGEKPIHIPPSAQRAGDPRQGYKYVIEGDYLKSGIPYSLFLFVNGRNRAHFLDRDSLDRNVPYNFNVVKAPNGVRVVVPNCLQCHAQVVGDSLVLGLGNTDIDFTHSQRINTQLLRSLLRSFGRQNTPDYEAAETFIRVTSEIAPSLKTEVRGVNVADRIAALLAAHRDPVTFRWSDTPMLSIPDRVVPTDVPAWWLLKKKHAMFYNGFGRGDFGKFLMASNLLTVVDTAEADAVDDRISDVLAWILSLQPPRYPYPIDTPMAAQGNRIFDVACARCHGTYGQDWTYPNLLVPESIIGTDSLLYQSNFQYPQFIDWFNRSWFSSGPYPARLVPYDGYIAPPLDGIWITAPYFHNGSVPTLEGVLNSKSRPAYWTRVKGQVFDKADVGWKYEVRFGPKGPDVYNTTLPGYGNYGHTYGDRLSDVERREVIEYLKTL